MEVTNVMMKSQQLYKLDVSYLNCQLKVERVPDEKLLLSDKAKTPTKLYSIVMASAQRRLNDLPNCKEGFHQTLASHV